jgi:SP family myo-inositol transporter-like MFS transporter 13
MVDQAEEPLMGNGHEDRRDSDVDVRDSSALLEQNLQTPGLFVWLLTFSAGISGLLFGCMLLLSAAYCCVY